MGDEVESGVPEESPAERADHHRELALHHATMCRRPDASTDEVLTAAKAFEAFLNGPANV